MFLQLEVKPGKDVEQSRRKIFEELVKNDSQVNNKTLSNFVKEAHFLAFLFIEGILVGTNAIKNNKPYQRTLEEKSAVKLPDTDFFGEVGYLHVEKDHRSAGLGDLLILGTLAAVRNEGLFATIQTKNLSSRRLFERHGFMQVGKSWASKQKDDRVNLYVRPGLKKSN
ncbi:GNAT family N-acetyltransferase [Roseibium sp. CAU 1637]|uniref:GNAT family N-acetyltransferase n=1 Tax=Roseibium limicola TaxID=2816037 RepID=A0A939EQP0_9HYPH|nr:GNAT family N-acetyltransferase [Roseibium limicola]MBO0346575.1 GNAT family N-acetyltransferase [Roseibium limicola]